MKNLKAMQNFTLKNIPDLDTCVLGALELFMKEKLPKINIKFKKPLVAGSGNAEATGRIIFRKKNALFASESNFKEKIKFCDGVVLISASGGKHAPIIAKYAKKKKKKVVLLTNNKDAEAAKYCSEVHVFPKQKEPYTYNTSTYMGMILAMEKESPNKIYNYLKKLRVRIPKNNKYFITVPTKFEGIKRMMQVKFIELFGRRIARDIETTEYVKHATTIVPSNEVFLCFGEKHNFGKNKVLIPLPKNAGYATMMAISYYIVGKIQKQHPQWFKNNIIEYTKKISKEFGKEIKPIVESTS